MFEARQKAKPRPSFAYGTSGIWSSRQSASSPSGSRRAIPPDAADRSTALGIAPGTLRMRLMRARARLRKAASPDLAHGTDPASEPEVKT